jgi:hypothetical protein
VGIETLDLPTSIRAQIPSFPDSDLRGFSDGFACKYLKFIPHTHTHSLTYSLTRSLLMLYVHTAGEYGLLVPYFNGLFSGKVARFNILEMNNVQEVDLMVDRDVPDTLKGVYVDAVQCSVV